jgi:hypothetical protein
MVGKELVPKGDAWMDGAAAAAAAAARSHDMAAVLLNQRIFLTCFPFFPIKQIYAAQLSVTLAQCSAPGCRIGC